MLPCFLITSNDGSTENLHYGLLVYGNKNVKKKMCSVCPVLCDWDGKCSLFHVSDFHVSVSDFGSIAFVLNVIAVFT